LLNKISKVMLEDEVKNRIDKIDGIESSLAEMSTDVIDIQINKADKSEIDTLATNKADKTEINTLTTGKADITYVDTKVAAVASGSPKDVFNTLADLQATYTAGALGSYLVVEDGKLYYWKNGTWTPIVQYQSTGLSDKSVDFIKMKNEAVSKLIQGSQSIFTQTTIEQNKTDVVFLNHTNRIFDFKINIPKNLDSNIYKRLYLTGIKSDSGMPYFEISLLNGSNVFVKIAEAKMINPSVNSYHYDSIERYIDYKITGYGDYANSVEGLFKFERLDGWNYYYNGGTTITYSDVTPHLGSYEISQNCIEYYDIMTENPKRPLPEIPSYNGMLKQYAPNFYSHYLKRDKDVVVMTIGDSISTANNYASDRLDSNLRPPICHDLAFFSYLEEKLRWKGQEYWRFDTSSVFTETATSATTSVYDPAWDWQVGYGAVNVITDNNKPAITRILDGTNVSVSYSYPVNKRRCNFIYRTDYLSASSATVTIAEGNGQVEVFDEVTQTWVEANGYTFSAKEADTVIDYTYTNYVAAEYNEKLRKSMYQKRLKMRSLSVLTAKTVTITNVGAGRLCYWGIEHSPNSNMIYFINSARGGHNMMRLKAYEEWDIDYWKPDLILWQSQILNEGASTAENIWDYNSPTNFTNRFATRLDELKAKSYAPEIITYTMFVADYSNLVNPSTGLYNISYIQGTTTAVSMFDYIGYLHTMYDSKGVLNLNMFYTYLQIAEQRAKDDGTNNIYTSAIQGSGKTGNTLTSDSVHPNDYGSKIASVLLLPLFKFLN
jgi:hypothetical protein